MDIPTCMNQSRDVSKTINITIKNYVGQRDPPKHNGSLAAVLDRWVEGVNVVLHIMQFKKIQKIQNLMLESVDFIQSKKSLFQSMYNDIGLCNNATNSRYVVT